MERSFHALTYRGKISRYTSEDVLYSLTCGDLKEKEEEEEETSGEKEMSGKKEKGKEEEEEVRGEDSCPKVEPAVLPDLIDAEAEVKKHDPYAPTDDPEWTGLEWAPFER